jgi:hypothetical protein
MICKLSRYTSNPSKDNWKAITRALDFKKDYEVWIIFSIVLEGYIDASWITSTSDNKPTSG